MKAVVYTCTYYYAQLQMLDDTVQLTRVQQTPNNLIYLSQRVIVGCAGGKTDVYDVWQVRDILYGNDADDDSVLEQQQQQQQQPDRCFTEHSLFIQLDVICHFDEDDSIGWKEMARFE